MTAIFPDSGVPPSDAKNSLPNPDTVNCDELWYSSSRCTPRFDPAQANAVISELLNLINKGEVTYDCKFLDQVQLAVRYLIQRGLPTGAVISGGPFDYTGGLDPPLTRYNDYLTLVVIPSADNQGAVKININGHGLKSLLRNDGLELEAKDLRANVPALISYWSGAWHHVGLTKSQTSFIATGDLDVWIRTDGNDQTGDGSANTADKAFKTIQGAWLNIGSRYVASPLFSINMKLGIPGTYAGAIIGPFGGSVSLSGSISNPGSYKISQVPVTNNQMSALLIAGVNGMEIIGVSLEMSWPGPEYSYGLRTADGAFVMLNTCIINVSADNSNASCIECYHSTFGVVDSDLYLEGNNHQVSHIFRVEGGTCFGAWGGSPMSYQFRNLKVAMSSFEGTKLSVLQFNSYARCVNSNVTGQRYGCFENSIINMGGETPPGSTAGASGSGGQYIP